jgi:hypothetical protein
MLYYTLIYYRCLSQRFATCFTTCCGKHPVNYYTLIYYRCLSQRLMKRYKGVVGGIGGFFFFLLLEIFF